MKKVIMGVCLSLVLVAVSALAGCLSNSSNDFEAPDATYSVITNEKNVCVKSSNEFAFDMYRELLSEGDNIFFSPYSISTAVGMAYEGANGKTATEIQSVLDLPADRATRLNQTKEVQASLNKEGTAYELNTANAYWLRDGADLEDAYKAAIVDYYLAHGEELDFAGHPSDSVDTINEWVSTQTNGKIKNLLSPADINSLTYLILTNAVYFKSDWKYTFDASATEDMDFTPATGAAFQTPTMHMCDKSIGINYAANDDMQMVQLPYKNEELSMLVLLPKDGKLSTVETALSSEYIKGLKDKISSEWMDIYLPKFKFEQKYALAPLLSDMGMPTAFSDEADFSGITKNADLHISSVIHQAFVEVNEQGTEAAAATAVTMEAGSAIGSEPEPEPIEFRADHPFIFLIEHKETGEILFMGKVSSPAV